MSLLVMKTIRYTFLSFDMNQNRRAALFSVSIMRMFVIHVRVYCKYTMTEYKISSK